MHMLVRTLLHNICTHSLPNSRPYMYEMIPSNVYAHVPSLTVLCPVSCSDVADGIENILLDSEAEGRKDAKAEPSNSALHDLALAFCRQAERGDAHKLREMLDALPVGTRCCLTHLSMSCLCRHLAHGRPLPGSSLRICEHHQAIHCAMAYLLPNTAASVVMCSRDLVVSNFYFICHVAA